MINEVKLEKLGRLLGHDVLITFPKTMIKKDRERVLEIARRIHERSFKLQDIFRDLKEALDDDIDEGLKKL